VSRTVDFGNVVYVKDGRRYPDGVTGRGLVAAVADNPVALESAHKFRWRKTAGSALVLGGLVCAPAFLIATRQDNGNPSTVGAVGALTCVVAQAVGLFFTFSSMSHERDALKIYNSGRCRASTPTDGLR
jgi:hypothetical protein